MSMTLTFEPHSWYRGAAVRHNIPDESGEPYREANYKWEAYIENGNFYFIDELGASTLKELKQKITEYRNNES